MSKFQWVVCFYLCFTLLQTKARSQEFTHNDKKYPWSNCLVGDVYLTLDFSGSIDGYELYLWETAEAIASGLLKENKKARLGIIGFDSEAYVIQEPTDDLSTVLQTIADGKGKNFINIQSGGTDISSGLQGAYYLSNNIDPSKYADENEFTNFIILISDGGDGDGDNGKKGASFRQATKRIAGKLKSNQWWIYSVFLPNHDTDDEQILYFSFMRDVSGYYDHLKEYNLMDSVHLTELPTHFREFFSCM